MTSTLPTTMRALFQPDPQRAQLILKDDVPLPIPNADEHLIRVHAAALTNGELLWPKNFPLPPSASNPKETTPCYDMSGTILRSPPGSPFPPGTAVFARTSYSRTGSGRAYTLAPASELARKPSFLSWAQSATVPMSAETAWQALFAQTGGLLRAERDVGAQGQRVYVTGASGAVGSWVVQLARWAGARVVGSASADNVARVRALGAHEAWDYRALDARRWAAAGANQVDLVIDCVGGPALADAWWAVAPGGSIVSIVQPPAALRPAAMGPRGTGVRTRFFIQEARGADLQMVVALWEAGYAFVSCVDSVFPLERFEEAVARAASGRPRGKVVLDFGVVE